MLDEAIELIEKQIDMYEIQYQNISSSVRRIKSEEIIKRKMKKEIKVRNYILEILKQKKEE